MLSTSLEIKIAKAILQLKSFNKKITQRKVQQITGGSFREVGATYNDLRDRFNNFEDITALEKCYQLERLDLESIFNENEKLKEENYQLSQKLTSQAKSLEDLKNSEKNYKNLYELLEEERASVIKQITEVKDQQINSLLEELTTMHKDHVAQYREFSYSHDDKLIQKEIKIKELTDELNKAKAIIQNKETQDVPQSKVIHMLQVENVNLLNMVASIKAQLAALKAGVMHDFSLNKVKEG